MKRTVEDDYRQLAELGHLRGARGDPLAPRRSRARTLRLLVRRALPRGCRQTRRRGHLGPLPLRLSRKISTCGARTSRSASPTTATPPPASSRRARRAPCSSPRSTSPPSWPIAAGEKGLFAPYGTGRGLELKVALVRAAIARHRRHPRRNAPMRGSSMPIPSVMSRSPQDATISPTRRAISTNASSTSHGIILSGRLLPELGGSRDHLDIVGINYYWTNQWEWRIEPLRQRQDPAARRRRSAPCSVARPRARRVGTLRRRSS